MRLRVLAGFALAALLCGTGMAQSDQGDQEYRSGVRISGTYGEEWQSAEANGWFRALDVTGVGFTGDTETTIRFLLSATDPFRTQTSPSEPALDFSALNLHFTFNGRSYLVQWAREANGEPTAVLYNTFGSVAEDRSAIYSRNASELSEVPWTEADGNGIIFEIPRDLIVGFRGEPLIPGSLVSDVYATAIGRTQNIRVSDASVSGCNSVAAGINYCYAEVRDRFPNEGVLGPFAIVAAPQHDGHLLYYSPQPQRGSNGEATTYIMELEVVNLGDEADILALEPRGIPDGWAVEVAASVEIPPGVSATVPIIVSVPFFHVHGQTRGFNLTGTSALAPSLAISQEFSVHWFDVAQPSGHHPTVFLHAGTDGAGWWNVLDEQPGADGARLEVQGSVHRGTPDRNPTGGYYEGLLRIPHLPAFSMGLDARMGEETPFVGSWEAAFAGSGIIEISVLHEEQAGDLVTGRTVLFEGQTEVNFQVGANPLELSLAPTPEADFFALRPGNLWIEVTFNLDMPPESYAAYVAGNPALASPPVWVGAGSRIRFALDEYHDSLAPSVEGSGGLALSLETNALSMHPGNVQVLEGSLTGDGSFEVELAGPAADWAAAVSAKVDASRPFNIVVKVPEDAEIGESRGLVVKLVDVDNPLRQVAKLVRIDTTAELQPDEAELADTLLASKDTAFLPTTSILLGVLVLAAFARRQQ